MKKYNLFFISVFSVIMIAFYGGLILWVSSCEKTDVAPEWNSTYPIRDIDTTILDPQAYQSNFSRSSDGFVDIVILGSKFKGRDGLNLFLQGADSTKSALLTIYPVTQYVSNIRFHYRNVKQDLGCNDNVSIAEGWICNEGKVIDAADEVSGGLFLVDQVIVLAYGEGRGGANGSSICAIGVGTYQNSQTCYFWNGLKGKVRHEFFHNLCTMNHPPCIPWNLMCTCGNGCCDIANAPLLPEHQTLVINYINSRIN